MAQTYFITGGFGFLGQYIVKAVAEYDPCAELRVMVRTDRPLFLPINSLEGVRFVRGDLSRPESFVNELKDVETVIHNAALVSFRKADSQAVYESNVIGTRNLIDASLVNRVRDFIFISSISTVAARPPQVSDETMLPDMEYKRSHDMYGYSKRMGEMDLQRVADRMRAVILNPSVILGPGSRRIEAVIRFGCRFPVIPMLPTINSFVDVRDVADAVVLALTKGRSGERYIVTGHNVDMVTFTRMTLAAMGMKAAVVPVSGGWVRLGDALVRLLDWLHLNPGLRRISEINLDKNYSNEKLRREMGWAPKFTLERSIADSLTGGRI
jgi:dihydroflavonol-4-reductase